MKSLAKFSLIAAAAAIVTTAHAQGVYKIGISAGLTGYAATVDRAWTDGVRVAVEVVNAAGGVNGRRLEVIVEDNRSEPQEAVTVYKKMISSDKVDAFLSGCVSAGNLAAAGMVAKAQIPMMLCSILPQNADHVKWAFSTLPPAGFEVAKRMEFLKENTQIKRVGVLHDPTPYANLQKGFAEKNAANFNLTLAGVDQYKQDDADLSVQIGKMHANGAGAVLKIGLGGTTLTAAKNIKQLGLPMLMLTSIEDLAVFRPVAEVLGPQFFFVAAPSQIADALPAGPLKNAIEAFMKPWKAKHGDRDPNWAGRGWDAVMLTVAAIQKANSFDGVKVRDAFETITGFQGTTGVYNFSPTVHQGITENPFKLATIRAGKVEIVK